MRFCLQKVKLVDGLVVVVVRNYGVLGGAVDHANSVDYTILLNNFFSMVNRYRRTAEWGSIPATTSAGWLEKLITPAE